MGPITCVFRNRSELLCQDSACSYRSPVHAISLKGSINETDADRIPSAGDLRLHSDAWTDRADTLPLDSSGLLNTDAMLTCFEKNEEFVPLTILPGVGPKSDIRIG